jgi:hypothetical protein
MSQAAAINVITILNRRESVAALTGFGLAQGAKAQTDLFASSVTSGIAPQYINVRNYGAKGDRHAADGQAIQAAITAASGFDQYPRSVEVPSGHYRRDAPLSLPNFIALRGEGPSSIFNSQNDGGFKEAILTNASPKGAVGWRLSDLSLYGGSHGVKLDVTGEVANLRFDDVGMIMQTVANIEANQLFQTTKFFGGVLGNAPYGLKVNGFTTNAFNSFGLEWTDHSKSSLYLRGAEGVLIVGGRFEGSGAPKRATIDLETASSVTFIGVYFENVHEYLARLRRCSAVSFVNCHFTGTHAGSPKALAPFKWDFDDSLVTFRDCHSSLPMPVPGNVLIEGYNVNIFPSNAVHKVRGLSGEISAVPRPIPADGNVHLLVVKASKSPAQSLNRFCCNLDLIVADPRGTLNEDRHRFSFDVSETAGVTKIIPRSKLITTISALTVALSWSADGIASAEFHVDDAKPAEGLELSWDVDWRRVAGSPTSTLSLYVP